MITALRLCLVTHLKEKSFDTYRPLLLQAIRGGITAVQLREKTTDLSALLLLARQLKATLDPFGIPLIINDHVDIAKEIDAAGVHLGQSDLHPGKARALLGPQKIIGLSIETLDELQLANTLTCIDYVGASAVFPSKTKPHCKTIWGLHGLQHLANHTHHPIVAIGGIAVENIKQIIEHGAYGAAVIGAIHDAPDPRRTTEHLITTILQHVQEGAPRCLRL